MANPPDWAAEAAKKKPQIHSSAISMLEKCGQRFFYRYIEGLRRPPGIAAVVGTAAHKTIQRDLENKLKDGTLLSDEAIEDLAAGALHTTWEERGVTLQGDDKANWKKAQGRAIDEAIEFASLHHEEVAPDIEPIGIEEPWVIETGSHFPFDLAGTWDVRETQGIRDSKTTRKTPGQNAAHLSEQLTMYALAEQVVKGQLPEKVTLDFLVLLKTDVKHVLRESVRTPEDIQMQLRRIERASEVINKGAFMPADPDSWWCSARWCGYFEICPYAKKPVSVAPGGNR